MPNSLPKRGAFWRPLSTALHRKTSKRTGLEAQHPEVGEHVSRPKIFGKDGVIDHENRK